MLIPWIAGLDVKVGLVLIVFWGIAIAVTIDELLGIRLRELKKHSAWRSIAHRFLYMTLGGLIMLYALSYVLPN